MDRKQAKTYATKFANEVIKQLNPDKILLYGSYATNSWNEDSDIDVAVIFNGFTDHQYKTLIWLWKIAYPIYWNIQPILLDIQNDPSGFVEYVIQTGELLYQRPLISS